MCGRVVCSGIVRYEVMGRLIRTKEGCVVRDGRIGEVISRHLRVWEVCSYCRTYCYSMLDVRETERGKGGRIG